MSRLSGWPGLVIAATTGGYALVSGRLARTAVSGPMVFVAVGLAVGPLGLDLISLSHEGGGIRELVEAALALLLFTDALAIQVKALRRDEFLPIRLLGAGLPLTIALGWLLAWPLLPGLSRWELALAGVILAPTDAALGQAAIANRGVPALVREGLNVESGLNDGMALPVFVIFLAAAAGQRTAYPEAAVFGRALIASTVIGAVIGWGGGRLLSGSRGAGWSGRAWQQIFVIAVVVAAYSACLAVDGSGFIGAWVAGLTFGASLRREPAAQRADVRASGRLTEQLAELLSSLSFFVFGAALLGPALQHFAWHDLGYAVLSLTAVRMLPVALALLGSGLRFATVGYVGWFGPRGLASIVLGLVVLEQHIPGGPALGNVVALTVGLSVLAHGVTAVPLAGRYARWYGAAAMGTPDLRESAAVQTREIHTSTQPAGETADTPDP